MQLGFQSRFVEAVCDQDGRNWKLLKPIVYLARSGQVYVVPRGASTDGASTPAVIASFLPPTGDYWLPAVLHDAAYRNSLLTCADAGSAATQPEDLQKAVLTREQADDLLLEAMELCGVGEVTRRLIYSGVRLGGAAAFKS